MPIILQRQSGDPISILVNLFERDGYAIADLTATSFTWRDVDASDGTTLGWIAVTGVDFSPNFFDGIVETLTVFSGATVSGELEKPLELTELNIPVDLLVAAAFQGENAVYDLLADYAWDWTGSTGNDSFRGGNMADTLNGEAGDDAIFGGGGNDTLNGGQGSDQLSGGTGDDTYYVDNGDDTIVEIGGYGADTVYTTVSYSLRSRQSIEVFSAEDPATSTTALKMGGNSYGNTIIGNAGANCINGGTGRDILTGNAGNDTFMFNSALIHQNVDTITDFNQAGDDTIRLENSIFTALTTLGTLAANAFVANTSGYAQDAQDRVIYETDTGKLIYDENGSAAGGRYLFAWVGPDLTLTENDFFVV